MSEIMSGGFTPQAEAAYPDAHWEPPFRDLQRTAFDAGRRSRDAEIAEQREKDAK